MARMKICLIGNSGLACVKKAWDEASGPLTDAVELTFFAASAYTTGSLDLEGPALTTTNPRVLAQFGMTSGGHQRIEIGDYDAFLIYGLTFEFRDYLAAFRGYALPEDRALGETRPLLSRAAHAQLIDDRYALRPGQRLAGLIREVSDAAIVMGSASYPTEAALGPGKAFSGFDPETDRGFLERLDARYRQEYRARCDANGWLGFVQPQSTMSLPGFTDMRYSKDGVGLPPRKAIKRGDVYRETPADDPWHLNGAFGAIVLEGLSETLGLGPETAARKRGWGRLAKHLPIRPRPRD